MGKRVLAFVAIAVTLCSATVSRARDLGDILVEKGLITPEELRQAREEDKQKVAAEESRREMIVAKLPKWLDMIQPFGDLRVRHEGFYEDGLDARNRFRFRARVGLNITPSDEVSATFRLASGDPNDPISANQTFNGTFTKKSVNFDQGFLALRPGKSVGLEPGWVWMTLGKFGVNAYRVSELVWYDDLKMTVGFADYDYENLNQVARKFLEKTSSSFNNSLANSNRLEHFSDGKISGYRSDFNLIEANGEVNFADVFGVVPAGLFGDLVYNTQASGRNLGLAVGAGIGKSGRDWYHDNLKAVGDWA